MRFFEDITYTYELFLPKIEALGPPAAIIAWLFILGAVVFLAYILKHYWIPKIWVPSLVVGLVSFAAHMMDYIATLQLSPDLSMEMNPIWRIVIDHYGLNIAKFYGLTGKAFLSILAAECFAYYIVQREYLFPKKARNFFSFWRYYGTRGRGLGRMRWPTMVNFFCFCLAFIGPFYFYVAFMNTLVDDPLRSSLPPILSVLFIDLIVVTAGYFTMTYRAFLERKEFKLKVKKRK